MDLDHWVRINTVLFLLLISICAVGRNSSDLGWGNNLVSNKNTWASQNPASPAGGDMWNKGTRPPPGFNKNINRSMSMPQGPSEKTSAFSPGNLTWGYQPSNMRVDSFLLNCLFLTTLLCLVQILLVMLFTIVLVHYSHHALCFILWNILGFCLSLLSLPGYLFKNCSFCAILNTGSTLLSIVWSTHDPSVYYCLRRWVLNYIWVNHICWLERISVA